MRHYLLLLEMDHLRRMLLEDRMTFLRQTYVPKLEAFIEQLHANGGLAHILGHVVQLPPRLDGHGVNLAASVLVDRIADADPSPQKRNTQWMLNLFLKQKLPLEDLGKANEYLTVFERVKSRLPVELRDLNRYQSIQNLFDTIEPYQQEQSQRELSRAEDVAMHEQAKVLYNDANYKIVIPLTKEASCYFGKNTQWCTAATSGWNAFEHYNSSGPMYIILDKRNNRRWQWHPATRQFMDERDHPVHMNTFLEENPEIAQIFVKMDGKPVAQLHHDEGRDPALVFKTHEGYVAKSQPGMLGKVLLTIEVQNGVAVAAKFKRDIHSDDVISLLNQLRVRGDPEGGSLISGDDYAGAHFYYRKGQWGYPEDVGTDIMRFPDGHAWRGVKFRGKRDMALVEAEPPQGSLALEPPETGTLAHARIVGELFTLEQGTDPSKKAYDVAPYVIDYLLKQKIAKFWDKDSEISLADFPTAEADRLLKVKPSFGDFKTVYKLYGVSKTARQLLMRELDELEIEHYDEWVDDQTLIIEKWKDIDECINEHGNRAAKYFLDIDNGERDLDVWGNADSYVIDRLFRRMQPELLLRLGRWLQETYPDEAESIEDYDPSNYRHVNELYEQVEDSEIESAANSAYSDGLQIGAQNEAHNLLKSAVEDANLYFFRNGQWTTEMTWDTEVAKAFPMRDIADNFETLSETRDWRDAFDYEIAASEPYNGLSDYDDEAADERFAEEIEQVVGVEAGTDESVSATP